MSDIQIDQKKKKAEALSNVGQLGCLAVGLCFMGAALLGGVKMGGLIDEAVHEQDKRAVATSVAGIAIALEDPVLLQAELNKLPETVIQSAVRLDLEFEDTQGISGVIRCSGTVVSNGLDLVVLTARHCVEEPGYQLVRVGVAQPHRGFDGNLISSSGFQVASDDKKDLALVLVPGGHLLGVDETPVVIEKAWDQSNTYPYHIMAYPLASEAGIGYQPLTFQLPESGFQPEEVFHDEVFADVVIGGGGSGAGVFQGDQLVSVHIVGTGSQAGFESIGDSVDQLMKAFPNIQ